MMALGFGAGWLGAWMADHADLSGWQLLVLLAAAAVGVLVQIVLHDGGHLAAGLATGYGFVSFRIGSVMLLKKDGRLQFCRYQLAGTGASACWPRPPGGRRASLPCCTIWAGRWPTFCRRPSAGWGHGYAGRKRLWPPGFGGSGRCWGCTWALSTASR